mgnify:CR=1 FL=1
MTTQRQRIMCMSFTRHFISSLIMLALVLGYFGHEGIALIMGAVANNLWLYLPLIVKKELALLDKLRSR